jgi:hypothetical protein
MIFAIFGANQIQQTSIDNKSFHCFQQKYAVYNIMSHRLTHIPLNEEETNKILAIGIENGYKN